MRQLLLAGGITARELPGRARKAPSEARVHPRELAPVIEAMWREGMLCHEIADVFGITCVPVHALICERIPDAERGERVRRRLSDTRPANERLVGAVRKAAAVLADAPEVELEHRWRAQALVAGWLAAYAQLAVVIGAASRAAAEPGTAARSRFECSAPLDLSLELDGFRADLRAAGLRESTIHAYLGGSSLFVRWLSGDYVPRGPRSG